MVPKDLHLFTGQGTVWTPPQQHACTLLFISIFLTVLLVFTLFLGSSMYQDNCGGGTPYLDSQVAYRKTRTVTLKKQSIEMKWFTNNHICCS